jgi:tetratricopeptide (TPR) repeat protein
MKNILPIILLCIFAQNSLGQADNAEMHSRFLQYLKMEKVDSIYHSHLNITPDDEGYEEALLFRNQNGWALNELEQLKKDIPAILQLPEYAHEMAYERVFRPQKFPPAEWNRFFEMSNELVKFFDTSSIEYREILGIKTKLEFITRNDSALLLDLPKLLERLNMDSEAYSAMLWQYGNLLLRSNNKKEAEKVFESGLNLNSKGDLFSSLIHLYSSNNDFEKIIKYEHQILEDSSGE